MQMSFLLCRGQSEPSTQPSPLKLNILPSDLNRNSTTLPLYFEKENPEGSSYLSSHWLRGTVEFSNHRRIQSKGQNLFFNFNKLNSILYVLCDLEKVSSYKIDSISSIELTGDGNDYVFEKVGLISNNFYLMPILKSAKGYSLYKRLFTRIEPADYSNLGYTTTGKKFDAFIDDYVYYIIYPGNKTFRKLYLKEKSVRRILKNESKLLDEFFSLHDNEINEESLLGIIQYIDDKKYPE
jgi:hypothetical protein